MGQPSIYIHNIFNSLTNAANEFGYFESSVIIIMFIAFVKGVVYILKLFKNERFKFLFSFLIKFLLLASYQKKFKF